MKNAKIAKIIQKSKTKISIEKDEISMRRLYINLFIKNIQQTIKQNPDIPKEEIRNMVLKNMTTEIEEYCSIANIQGRYFQYEATLKLLEDKGKIAEIYRLLEKDGIDNIKSDRMIYLSSHEVSCRTMVKQAIFILKDLEDGMDSKLKEIVDRYNNGNSKEKERIEKKFSKSDDRDNFIKIANNCKGSIIDKLYETIKQTVDVQEKELRTVLTETMGYIFKKFNEYNLLKKYKKSNDGNMMNSALRGYTYELSTKDYSKDNFGIEELFSKEILDTLDLEDVITLGAFWQNRYSKEIESIGEAFFTIDTLGLWDDIINGETNIEISDSDIEGVYNKILCLRNISASFLDNIKGKNKEITQEELELGYKKVSSEDEINNIVKQEWDNYRNIFDEHIPKSPNNLLNDMVAYYPIFNHIENIYMIRNTILGCRIRELTNSKKCKNWGIIEEDSKEKMDDYVLVGIDHEGLNMPLRLHIKREILVQLLKGYNGKAIIPVYEGAKDFYINRELIPTNILMPLQNKQKKVLREKHKSFKGKNSQYLNLIEHLRFLADQGKYPEHLKEEIYTPKGIKKVRLPRKYIDLETGEFFENKNDEYIKIENSGGRNDDGR